MPTVKTAISIDKELDRKVTELSRELHISKSRIFSQAVSYFIEKKENLELLRKINEVYSDEFGYNEKEYTDSVKVKHSEIIERW